MIEADDVEPPTARVAAAVDVIFGIDQEPRLVAGDIPSANRVNDLIGPADQQATAFCRRGLARVGHDFPQSAIRNPQCHSASMAMAIPMPPPMHSEATPYFSF